jgi:hypothetical protein
MPLQDLRRKLTMERQIAQWLERKSTSLAGLRALREKIKTGRERAGSGTLADRLAALDRSAAALEGGGAAGGGSGSGAASTTLTRVVTDLNTLYNALDRVDRAPTVQATADYGRLRGTVLELTIRWERLQGEAKALDPQLLNAGPPAREMRSR